MCYIHDEYHSAIKIMKSYICDTVNATGDISLSKINLYPKISCSFALLLAVENMTKPFTYYELN